MMCQFAPSTAHSDSRNPSQIRQEVSDSRFVPLVGVVREDAAGIHALGSLDQCVEFWAKRLNHFTSLIGSFVFGVPCVGEEMVQPNRKENKQNTGDRNLTWDDRYLAQAIFLLIIVPVICALITVVFWGSKNND